MITIITILNIVYYVNSSEIFSKKPALTDDDEQESDESVKNMICVMYCDTRNECCSAESRHICE